MLLGPFTSKAIIIVLGYLWPAYQSYKAISANSQQLLGFWCKYWLILGLFLAVEWLADSLAFWIPLYHEAKVLFILFLWHPRLGGAVTVYERVIQPALRANEAQIDSTLEESKARIADTFTGQLGRVRDLASNNASTILDGVRKFSESSPRQPSIPTHPHKE